MNKKTNESMFVWLMVMCLGALVSSVQAVPFMVQPEGVVATLGSNGLADGSRPVANLINGTGLSDATLVETGAVVPGTLPTHSNVLNDQWRMQISDWASIPGNYDVTLTFDLDLDDSDSYDITGVYLWNYSEGGNYVTRGLNKVVIQSSTDGINYTQVGSGDFDFARAATTATYAPQYVDFGTTLTGVSNIRFVMQGQDSNDTDTRWLGSGEVRFTAVLEPAVTIAGGATSGSTTNSIGWRFAPTNDILVTALGVYDIDGGGLSGDHTVRLYNQTADTIITNVVVPQSTLGEAAGGFNAHYVAVDPFVLQAGNTYLIARNQGPDSYQYDTSIAAGAELGFVTGVSVAGNLPLSASSFNMERPASYFGPNFKYEEALAVTVDVPDARAVYQRGTNNTATISISGSLNAEADTIEVRAVTRAGYKGTDVDWTTLSISNGTVYSGTIELAGGWYDIEVRAIKEGLSRTTARVERVGVGDIFITCGQSNSANHGGPQQTPSDDRVNAFNLATMSWQPAADPQPYASGTGGSAWPDFGDMLVARTEAPVAVIAVGVGSTRVSQWLPGGYYSKILLAMNAMKPYGGFRAILWHQGESDGAVGTTASAYAGDLNTIIAQSRTDAGFDVPWGVALASWLDSTTESNQAMVLAGQQLVISNTANVFKGAETDSFHTLGWNDPYGAHFNDLGLRDHGRQWVNAVCSALLSDDRDHDGMPDLWMLMHFGHATGSATDKSRATDDADGDGVSNLDEYRATTDPKNIDAILKLDRIEILTNATVRVTWPAVLGRTYRIRSTGDLSSLSAWDSSPSFHSYGSSMAYEESLSSISSRFFCVQAEQL